MDAETNLGEEQYGEEIIYKRDRRQLIYNYGDGDRLVIDGFQNGDYGINLRRDIEELEEEDTPMTYTPNKVMIDPFEFKVLEKLEITKEIDDHTRVRIEGGYR